MRYDFILRNKELYPVEKMCHYMKVSKNSYYHWIKTKDKSGIKSSKIILKQRIKALFKESKQIYVSYRIREMLKREGLIYSRSYIGLLMKEMGLRSILKRKYVITTNSNHSFNIANNELNREFRSETLGEKWVSDITYIRVNDDWNYLTTIIDLADRKIVQSMSRKGNCWDNAVAESFFKTIKHEWLYRFKYTSYNQLFESINEYINWYNNIRIHSSLGYLSTLEKEMQLRKIINKAA